MTLGSRLGVDVFAIEWIQYYSVTYALIQIWRVKHGIDARPKLP